MADRVSLWTDQFPRCKLHGSFSRLLMCRRTSRCHFEKSKRQNAGGWGEMEKEEYFKLIDGTLILCSAMGYSYYILNWGFFDETCGHVSIYSCTPPCLSVLPCSEDDPNVRRCWKEIGTLISHSLSNRGMPTNVTLISASWKPSHPRSHLPGNCLC